MGELFDKSFVVVAGKGGVGRTTVSLALGRLAASRGRRTLVCLANAPPRYFDLIGGVAIDSVIRPVLEDLDVVNLNPRASQEEYGLQVLKNRTLHRLIFGSRIVRSFLDAVPGLAEWAMLGKATYHALHTLDGRPEYDLVVLDSPATGHGLDILALPRSIAGTVRGGRMHDEAVARQELLEDAERSEVLPVAIPEEIPVNETVEFVAALHRLDLNVERVVINMVDGAALHPEVEKLLRGAKEGEALPSWLNPAAAAAGRIRAQEESIARLEEKVPVPQHRLPLIPGGSLDEASLLTLVACLSEKL